MATPTLPTSQAKGDGALDWQPVEVTSLRVNPANPRSITKKRFDDLKHSLQSDPQMLETRPLVALPDGTVIMGNMRLRAVQELGWATVPTTIVELDEDRARQWLLRDNVGYGDWVEDGLAELMYELHQAQTDMRLTGFDEASIRQLLASVAPDDDETGQLLPLVEVTMAEPDHDAETGMRWRLRGEHVLVCDTVFDGWPRWIGFLQEGMLLVPYPSPNAIGSNRTKRPLLMIQPDAFICGHMLDTCALVAGEESIERLDDA